MDEFKIEISTLLEDEKFIDALTYVQNKFYGLPYTFCANNIEGNQDCVYTDVVIYKEEFLYDENKKQDIHRPNNGLVHAFRSAVLTYVLSRMYNERAMKLLTKYKDIDTPGAKRISDIGTAIGALFLQTGRVNDGSMSKFPSFSETALKHYIKYIEQIKNEKIYNKETNFICIAIKEAYKKPYKEDNPVSRIFDIVNKLELVRCCVLSSDETLKEDFKEICDIETHLPDLVKLSLDLLKITGDRIELIDNINLDFTKYTYYGSLGNLLKYVTGNNDRRNETFYEASSAIDSLLGLIPSLESYKKTGGSVENVSSLPNDTTEIKEYIKEKSRILTEQQESIKGNINKLKLILSQNMPMYNLGLYNLDLYNLDLYNKILELEKARLASIEKVHKIYENSQPPQQGGSHYKEKYLKYKNKYLELRQRAGKEFLQNLRGGN
jgi:hypothetical protein